MKIALATIIAAIVAVACASEPKNDHIVLVTEEFNLNDTSTMTRTASRLEDEYIELSLSSYSKDEVDVYYQAHHWLKEPSVSSPTGKRIWVVGSDERPIRFANSTEFLNFMAMHGFSMVDKKESRYRTDYTFKRKD